MITQCADISYCFFLVVLDCTSLPALPVNGVRAGGSEKGLVTGGMTRLVSSPVEPGQSVPLSPGPRNVLRVMLTLDVVQPIDVLRCPIAEHGLDRVSSELGQSFWTFFFHTPCDTSRIFHSRELSDGVVFDVQGDDLATDLVKTVGSDRCRTDSP